MMEKPLHVAVNGWYAGAQGTGSGQYVDRLLEAMAGNDETIRWSILLPEGMGVLAPPAVQRIERRLPPLPRQLQKLWWEQCIVPHAARAIAADALWVPYWAAPWWQPVPTVVTVHDLIPLLLPENRGGLFNRIYTSLVAASARKSSRIIAVSHASKRDIVAHLGVPDAKVQVVWHGPNLEGAVRPTSEQMQDVREKYALPERYFLYLGGFEVRKNIAGILEGYVTYLRQGGSPKVKMVIAGKLPQEDTAFTPDPRRIARELGIAEHLCLPGFIDEADKPTLYAGATAFLFASKYEGFGMMLLEAQQFGAPVITSLR